MRKEEYRILSTTAILGYGFPVASFEEGMKRNPHLIAVDAGSTDPGPYYLGAGVSFTDRGAVKRDLEYMIKAGVEKGIPVCIGTAGGSGGKPHLDWNREIIEEIARE
ncbi:MAG: 3-methylaspartate ammonia-lyase, partial [Oscillospiraceae bacterium]|nr:3-methylaspartate ammonia-lyase [Oscillospiraceae bacterium]